MNLTSPSQVKAWCIEHEFHPNKVLGQNFLIDQNALKAIVDAGLKMIESSNNRIIESEVNASAHSAIRPADHSIIQSFDYSIIPHVLEIGPGLGVLTEEMLNRGCRVTAIEKDPVLAERLAASLGNPPNLTVIADDALAWLARQRKKGDRDARDGRDGKSSLLPSSFFPLPFSHMISNLPYQAGTRILLELVQKRAIPSLTVLVQTEVAERLAAPEGSKTRGLAGVWAQLDYDVKIVRKVSASCFWPRPEIGSSVVRLDRHDRNGGLSDEQRRVFYRLTKRAFEHRRKQLGSVFKNVIQSTNRAEDLSNADWVALAQSLSPTDV